MTPLKDPEKRRIYIKKYMRNWRAKTKEKLRIQEQRILLRQIREGWEDGSFGHACLCCGDAFSFIKALGLEEIT